MDILSIHKFIINWCLKKVNEQLPIRVKPCKKRQTQSFPIRKEPLKYKKGPAAASCRRHLSTYVRMLNQALELNWVFSVGS